MLAFFIKSKTKQLCAVETVISTTKSTTMSTMTTMTNTTATTVNRMGKKQRKSRRWRPRKVLWDEDYRSKNWRLWEMYRIYMEPKQRIQRVLPLPDCDCLYY